MIQNGRSVLMNVGFMLLSWLRFSTSSSSAIAADATGKKTSLHSFWRMVFLGLLSVVLMVSCWLADGSTAIAGLTDDSYDGNIFALYAGNGSLVPPKITVEASLKGEKPTLVVFYVDDSSDCKQYSGVISQVQAFYGRVIDILPIRVDSLPVQSSYAPTEAGYYYKGLVPQTVLMNQSGKVVLDAAGVLPFEQVDDVLRQVFDLLPRSQSVILKRRQVNEVNTELVSP